MACVNYPQTACGMQLLHNLTTITRGITFSYSHEKQEQNHVAYNKMQKNRHWQQAYHINRQNAIDYSVNNESKPTEHPCDMQLMLILDTTTKTACAI